MELSPLFELSDIAHASLTILWSVGFLLIFIPAVKFAFSFASGPELQVIPYRSIWFPTSLSLKGRFVFATGLIFLLLALIGGTLVGFPRKLALQPGVSIRPVIIERVLFIVNWILACALTAVWQRPRFRLESRHVIFSIIGAGGLYIFGWLLMYALLPRSFTTESMVQAGPLFSCYQCRFLFYDFYFINTATVNHFVLGYLLALTGLIYMRRCPSRFMRTHMN